MNYKLTRFAPTPSGFLHLGNIFSFAVTAALARRSSAAILLRIDDLDRERAQREYLEDIFETLRFMGLSWDIGPRSFDEFSRDWSQVQRLPLYREALAWICPGVFACSCSRAEVLRVSRDGVYPGTCRDRGLSLDRGEVSWRLRTEGGLGAAAGVTAAAGPEILRVKTWPEGAVEASLPAEMRDFVVRKKDGYPAYQLSSVIDDLHYGVDLIVRGQDLWASTLAQQYLSYPLGAEAFRDIHFYHHSLLVSTAGEKLSKSAGDTSVQYLRRQGLQAPDVYGLIARKVVGVGAEAADGADETVAGAVRDWEGLAALVLGG